MSLNDVDRSAGNSLPTANEGDDASKLVCGDGFCHPSENVELCEADCAYCGDGKCSWAENGIDCPDDCTGDATDVPGDDGMVVPEEEDPSSGGPTGNDEDTATDFSSCGDGEGGADESVAQCPADCSPPPPPSTGPQPDLGQRVIGHVDGIAIRDGE